MNIMNKLTLRHMKLNRRRTIITIIGVIISVAMITAVTTSFNSFLNYFSRQSIYSSGEWHLRYSNIKPTDLNAIESIQEKQTTYLSRNACYLKLGNPNEYERPYIFIREYDKTGLDKMSIRLTEGRLPQNSNEIIIPDILNKETETKYNVGDTITLESGYRILHFEDGSTDTIWQNYSLVEPTDDDPGYYEEFQSIGSKTYTICGIMENPGWDRSISPGYTAISYLNDNTLTDDSLITASVIMDPPSRKILKEHEALCDQLAQNSTVGIEFSYNRDQLAYMGIIMNEGLFNALLTFVLVMIIIIMIGSVAMIRNAFAISVSERSRYLGILSSVGATAKQKRKTVYFESFIIAVIGIPLGIIAGIGGIAITFKLLDPLIQNMSGYDVPLLAKVSVISIIIAVIFSALTIFISAYIPARKSGKISPIESIRRNNDINIKGKDVKTSKLTQKIFGFEAALSLKNLKRNRKQYRATIFSLIISIVLFLSTVTFTSYVNRIQAFETQGYNFDITINIDNKNPELQNEFYNNIANSDEVNAHSVISNTVGYYADIDKSLFTLQFAELLSENNISSQDDKIFTGVNIYALDDDNLKALAEQTGVSIDSLKDINNPAGIVINNVITEYDLKRVEGQLLNSSAVGQTINAYEYDSNGDEIPLNSPIKIAAVTDSYPLGITGFSTNIQIITSQEVFNNYFPEDEMIIKELYLTLNEDADSSEFTKQIYDEAERLNIDASVTDMAQSNLQLKQMETVILTFIFGFIALISLICVTNILNTISTGIQLRKREFAMLKSVGMTPKGFNRMIRYESLFYGIKAILWGIPISIIIAVILHFTLLQSFSLPFSLPWLYIIYVCIAVLLIVSICMLYSSSKVKKQNIIDGLREENF